MSKKAQEKIVVVPIPENFATEGTFLGYEIKMLNIVQAVVFAVIPFLIFGFLDKYFEPLLNVTTTLVIRVMISLGLAALGFFGINHETPLEMLIKYLNFKKNERKTYYNPRVKIEARSLLYKSDEDGELLPRDKIIKMYNDFLEKRNLSDQKFAHELEGREFDEDILFEDDFGVVEKPEEYMTAKELKEKKKEEKRAIRMRKKLNKELMQEEKRNAKYQKEEDE